MRFTDRHVIVTGAAAGIGCSIARRFAAEGARVVVADINVEQGARVAAQLRETGAAAAFIDVDVAQEASIAGLLEQASAQFGPVHVAVANAGVAESASSALEVSTTEWDRVFEINARGAFLFARAAAQNMVAHEVRGAIVTISSLMARSGKGNSGAYAASKASVIMFSKTLARCLGPSGIRVNSVSPGVVDTQIYRQQEQEMGMQPGLFVDWLVGASVKAGQLPLGRKGEPDEIAAAVAFLASEEASYITAQNLSVDGGMDWSW